MDFEKEKRRQTLKVIASESLMVMSVVALVIVLVLVVSGYWINADFEVERSGLLQVSSVPTGSIVTVDGNVWFQHTNTSKMVTSAEHNITISKDGYDTWSRDIKISEGLLYRLHYPRLFLLEREKESVLPMDELVKVTVSPKRDALLVYQSTGWGKVSLNSDTPTIKALTSAEATDLLLDWEKITKEAENYDEEGNILMKFYEDEYIVAVKQDLITVTKKDGGEKVLAEKLPFVPEQIKVGHAGEFIVMSNDCSIATLNMEIMNIAEWEVENESFGWIDNDMIYAVNQDGVLVVYDYDGLNRREITDGVSEKWPVMITNDKWLYYFYDGVLMREWLIPR